MEFLFTDCLFNLILQFTDINIAPFKLTFTLGTSTINKIEYSLGVLYVFRQGNYNTP